MRVVFMGTPEFAVPSLRMLARDHEVVAVYTRPDAASGRGGTLRPSPVKQAAEELGLAVRQPPTLRDAQEHAHLASLAPEVLVVAAYGLILPAAVLDAGRLGAVNVHASLLPRWRGAAPIERAILAGDEIVGVSIMRMEEGLDTGPYCATASTEVADKSAAQLAEELSVLGAELLGKTLPRIADGTCEWVEQEASQVTYAEKILKPDVALLPSLTVLEALRRVRASGDRAPARASVAGRGVSVLEAHLAEEPLLPGAVRCTKRALLLGFLDGAMAVDLVKPDGKGAMAGCSWARGLRLDEAATWGAAS